VVVVGNEAEKVAGEREKNKHRRGLLLCGAHNSTLHVRYDRLVREMLPCHSGLDDAIAKVCLPLSLCVCVCVCVYVCGVSLTKQ
jgi:hypothetical protein